MNLETFILEEELLLFMKKNFILYVKEAQCLIGNKEEFNSLVRGYYLDGDLVFYKDNFTYDANVITKALNYVNKIKKFLGVTSTRIYFGLVIGKPGEDWQKAYYYGDSLPNNTIVEK